MHAKPQTKLWQQKTNQKDFLLPPAHFIKYLICVTKNHHKYMTRVKKTQALIQQLNNKAENVTKTENQSGIGLASRHSGGKRYQARGDLRGEL
jgi:predicted transglutaminase-like protease